MADYGRGVEIGPQVPQREFKGYNIWSEVIIPILQALTVLLAVDLIAGLALYLAIQAGPQFWRFAIGLLLLAGTAVLAFSGPGDERRLVMVLLTGSLLLVIQQVGIVRLTPLWPWDWPWWRAWERTYWVGPFTGLGILIWRFFNEVRDPFWPRLEQQIPLVPAPQTAGREKPVMVQVEVSDQSAPGKPTNFLGLAVEPSMLAIFARAVLNGMPISEKEWMGKGRLFSPAEYFKMRDQLLAAKLAKWVSEKSNAQGMELTPAGRAVFARLAEIDPLPY